MVAKTLSPAETIMQLSQRRTSRMAQLTPRRTDPAGTATRPAGITGRAAAGHKLRLGQTVTLLPTHYGSNRNGNFKVISLLPQEHGVNHYRLKSVTDGHERIANENELT